MFLVVAANALIKTHISVYRLARNKAELVEEVANQTGLTKKTSREAVNAIISAITHCLGRKEKVTLVGFGAFQVMERKARRGENRRTARTILTSEFI